MLFYLVVAICLFVSCYYTKFREILEMTKKFPGPPRLPILGNISIFMGKSPTEQLALLTSVVQNYPRLTCLMLGPIPEIFISDPHYAEVILSSQKFIDKSDEYEYLKEWIATGLLTATGKKYFQRRKVITPAFHFKILEQFVEIFDKHSSTFIKNLEQAKGKPIDVFKLVKLCTLDNICETAMRIDIQAQTKSDSMYVRAGKEMTALLSKRIFTFYLRPPLLFNLSSYRTAHHRLLKILHDFTDSVIVNRREELMRAKNASNGNDIEHEDIGAKKKMAFLDVLLHSTIEGKSLTNLDIREEVDTFMFEGHDTTSSGLVLCLYELARHPDIQQKAHDEVISVLGKDPDVPVTISLLNDLNYLEMVIKETLRLYPSIPMYSRKLNEHVQVGEYLFPKGSNVAICPYFMARDPTLWDDPLKFDPERFSSEKQLSHPYLYIPFSAGPRNCIGQRFAMLQMKSTISKVLRHFELKVQKGFEPIILSEITLRSENGIWLELKTRRM